ncbi:MAG TPA: DinB family protein [Acidimicrobiia bacterium]|jgi:hypothetical protein
MDTDTPTTYALPLREQLDVFVDEHRAELATCLEGVTEEQARRRMVRSDTTLLGLVKHATFVEQIWFGQGISGASNAELGMAANAASSFELADGDTIASVLAMHGAACAHSRRAAAALDLDDLVTGNRRGPLPLRWVYLHVLRELAQHCGHADILREQILEPRDPR